VEVTAVVLDSNGQSVQEGQVTFTDGNDTITVPVQNGTATATFTGLEEGRTFTATYSDRGGSFADSTHTAQYSLGEVVTNELRECISAFFDQLVPG
jgi:hypothetical protein